MGIRLRAPFGAVALFALSVSQALAQPAAWTAMGPAPINEGQTEGIPNGPAAGAIHAIAPHPTNADILYVGSVNGGVWKTTNATAASPTWTRLTDPQLSNSIGDLTFDPTDATRNTLVAGVARFSSFASFGGRRIGVLRTTDGGSNWTLLGNNLTGKNVSGVLARGSTIVASVDIADSFTCGNIGLFRSTDGGANFAKVAAAAGFPAGAVDALAADPSNNATMYASLALAGPCAANAALNGIYKSTDTGATWSKVSTPAMDTALTSNASGDNVRISTAAGNVVVVAIARGNLLGVYHSNNGGTGWTSMSLPSTIEGATTVGLHPGGQASLHLSLAVDPGNANLVYVGGDRQPIGAGNLFPNSSGAFDFSGRAFRGDVTQPAATQWTRLTHVGAANNSSPHADSREMAFDANGRLLEADDGGLYARLSPQLPTGAWISLNGNLQLTEQHSAVYDGVANVGLSGNQDNGSSRQVATGNTLWSNISGGDGGDVATDELFFAAQNRSIGYSSSQNLGNFRRRVQSAANAAIVTEFPAGTITSGPGLVPQFVNPIAVNQVAGGRLVFGAANAVYESLNRADTLAEIPSTVAGQGVQIPMLGIDAIGYGAADNVEALYVGGCLVNQAAASFPCLANTAGVYRRTAAGGSLSRVYAARSGSQIQGLTLDPDDSLHAFALESATASLAPRVLRTVDGTNWVDFTGNIAATAGELRAVLYLPHPDNDLVVVGADAGVFVTSRQRGFNLWTPLGTGMPIVPIYDLSYDRTDDVLHAGTLGRGSFSLARVASGPVTVADSASTQRGVPVAIDVLANDSDVGGTIVRPTLSITSPPVNGTIFIDPTTSVLTYTPSAGFAGTETIAYRVRDDLGTPSNVSLVSIRVNAPPVAGADSVVTQRNTPIAISVLGNDSDADGTLDPASVAIVAQPASGTLVVAASGIVTYTPAAGFAGTVNFTYEVRDNENIASNIATVTVKVNAPPAAVADAVVAQRNTALPIAVLSNDTDGDGSLDASTVAITSSATNGTTSVSNDGIVTYTPANGYTGADSFAYTVRDDDSGLSNAATVTIRVNAAPVAVADDVVAQRNTALPIAVIANDTDSDGTISAASVVITTQPASGTVALAPTGVVTYTPANDFAGNASFAYTVQDNDGATSAPATVGVRVNAPPVAEADAVTTAVTAVPIDVLANDSDADGTLVPATVEIVTAPATGTTSIAADGTITFTPAGTGVVTFTYRVFDNDGAASNAATVTVTITANVAPFATDDELFVTTGATATTLVGGATSLTANDIDANGDALTVTTTPVMAPQHGTLTLAANGSFSYAHDGGTAVNDEFTYSVCDPNAACDTARVVIRIGELLYRDSFE